MPAYTTRKSLFGVKEESTNGTPIDLASGADIIAVQDGFEVSPSFETIDNNELSPNIGSRAPILGIEAPSASLSHYIRHSGTEATAPNYDALLKNVLGGKTAAFSEKTTTTGSTAGSSAARATVILASGGTSFERGHAVLIKDSTNGYNIRNVLSISTNTLTLLHNLTAAPATGMLTGRPILYKPADAPAALSLWSFRANEAAKEVVTGAQVSEMSIEAEAGQPLNASFNFEGVGYYFNPIRVNSADAYIDFNDGGVKVATVTVKLYKSPHDLASAIQTAMNAASSGFTVVYNDTGANAGKFTFTKASGTFSILASTGTNVANGIWSQIGFAATDLSAALTYTSDTVQSWASPYSATVDANTSPIVVKYNEVLFGQFDRFACAGAQSFSFNISKELQNVPDICAESGVGEKLITKRVVTAELTLTLAQHDADAFRKFSAGDTTQFSYNGGVKSGGNWVAGRCVNICMPQCKISSFQLTDSDGIVTIQATLTAFMEADGLGEVYVNFL